MIRVNGKLQYFIDESVIDRFDYLVKKIEFAKTNGHREMYDGYSILLIEEFKKYLEN